MKYFAFLRRRRAEPAAPQPPAIVAAAQIQPLADAVSTVKFFRVRTGRANWLAAGEDNAGEAGFLGMRAVLDASVAAIAIIPDAARHLCFLAAPDGRALSARSDGMRSVAISAYSLATDAAGLVRLKHPLDPMRYMAVTEPGQGGPEGFVIFDSLGDSMLSVFGLLPLAASDVPAGVRDMAAELGLAASSPLRCATLLAHLRSGKIRLALAETVLRLLPVGELALLARTLLEQPAELALLRRAMPDDPWMAKALPALAAWHRDPDGVPGHVLHSPVADQFAAEPFEGVRVLDLGLCLQALARRQTTPRSVACILATARNEGAYMLDWIAYHLSIGFEHIFLYTNDNADGSDALLNALAEHGVITLVNNATGAAVGPQYKAYAHALLLLPQILDYRWTAVIDLDEYIAFDARMFGGIADFLAFHETQPVDAVALCWLLFAADRQQGFSTESTLARFRRREPAVNPHVKSVFRTKDFWQSQAHFPRATLDMPFVSRTETGVLHHHHGVQHRSPAHAEQPSAQIAWINHYLLRSAPEALWKLSRGRGDFNASVMAEREAEHAAYVSGVFLSLSAPGYAVEDRRIDACAAGQAAMLARLLALPGVAEIDARIKASFAETLTRIVEAFAAEAPRPGEPADMGRLRDILAAQVMARAG